MVIRLEHAQRKRQRGALMAEVAVGISILVAVLLPLSLAMLKDQKLCRAYYYRAVAMEIVDGEMEILAAGEWRAFKNAGAQPYPVRADAAKNLPPGHFILTRQDKLFRLEWVPKTKLGIGPVFREWRTATDG
jgi:hypothetical protein